MASPIDEQMQASHNSQDSIMIVKKLRLKRGWSQQQLAIMTGLNVRTIQRIERGRIPSLESQKALASVFEIGIETFQQPDHDIRDNEIPGKAVGQTQTKSIQEETMNTDYIAAITDEEKLAMRYAKSIKEFFTHLFFYVVFVPIIAYNNGFADSKTWFICGVWTIGVIFHGLYAHEKITLFSPKWERKLIEKKLGRKL